MAAVFGNNANVMETKQKTLSAEYFNTRCSVKYNAYPIQKPKTVAEKEAWKLVTINPGLILSPSLSPTSKSRSLSLLDQLLGGQLFLGVPDMWFAIFDL